jgi:hypothetical protein
MVYAMLGLYTLSCVGAGEDIDWAQLSTFHLKTETKFSLRNVVFKKEGQWKIVVLFS